MTSDICEAWVAAAPLIVSDPPAFLFTIQIQKFMKHTCIQHSLIICREGLILKLSILPCRLMIIECRHSTKTGIGKSILSNLEVSLGLQDFGSRKSLGRQGWISQYLQRNKTTRLFITLAKTFVEKSIYKDFVTNTSGNLSKPLEMG